MIELWCLRVCLTNSCTAKNRERNKTPGTSHKMEKCVDKRRESTSEAFSVCPLPGEDVRREAGARDDEVTVSAMAHGHNVAHVRLEGNRHQ